MTEQEAIEITMHCLGVQAEQEVCEECPVYHESHITCKEAASIAISLLQEIQQYREIGTVEECREAVEKQKDLKSDWIPVKERLPNHDNCVLMCSHRGGMDVGWYDGKKWRTGYSHADVVNDIIAWCPLPEPYHG